MTQQKGKLLLGNYPSNNSVIGIVIYVNDNPTHALVNSRFNQFGRLSLKAAIEGKKSHIWLDSENLDEKQIQSTVNQMKDIFSFDTRISIKDLMNPFID